MSQIRLYAQAAFKELQVAQQALEKAEAAYNRAKDVSYEEGTHEADLELEVAYEVYQEKCAYVAEREAGYKRLAELVVSDTLSCLRVS